MSERKDYVMKRLLFLGLSLGVVVHLTSFTAKAKGCEKQAAAESRASGLQLSLVAQKRRFKRTDQLTLNVMLTNRGKNEVYVFGTLDWGYSASFTLHIRDAWGKDVKAQGFFDDLTSASPDDKSAFVKLLPDHFLGTNFFSPLDILNLNRPGKYAIFVQYHSPFSTADVNLSPFWGKESGALMSNIVWIEVVR